MNKTLAYIRVSTENQRIAEAGLIRSEDRQTAQLPQSYRVEYLCQEEGMA